MDRWKRAHPQNVELHNPLGDDLPTVQSGDILHALQSVKPGEMTQEVATQIIGNRSWVYLRCEHCMQEQDKVIRFGASLFNTKSICRRCLHDAMEAMDNGSK